MSMQFLELWKCNDLLESLFSSQSSNLLTHEVCLSFCPSFCLSSFFFVHLFLHVTSIPFCLSLMNLMLDFWVTPKLWGREYDDSEPKMIQTLVCRRSSFSSHRKIVFCPQGSHGGINIAVNIKPNQGMVHNVD